MATTTRTTTTVDAAVLGRGTLVCELVSHALLRAGLSVAEHATDWPDDADDDAAPARVIVLVDPEPLHWQAARRRAVPIVLVAATPLEARAAVHAIARGADAVLDLNTPPDEVVDAVKRVGDGLARLHSSHVRALVDVLREDVNRAATPVLTPREADILTSICRGESVKQTALVLGISAKTVENVQSRLFRKLGVRNRAQAAGRAHALGLAPRDDATDATEVGAAELGAAGDARP